MNDAFTDLSQTHRDYRDRFMTLPFPPYCPLDGWPGDCLHFDQHENVHLALHLFDKRLTDWWGDQNFDSIERLLRSSSFSTPEIVAELMALIRR